MECHVPNADFFPNRLADIDLEPFETEITTKSSPLAIALAKHLQLIGAKMYGAFWCSHCLEQKQVPFSSKKILLRDLHRNCVMEMQRNVPLLHGWLSHISVSSSLKPCIIYIIISFS